MTGITLDHVLAHADSIALAVAAIHGAASDAVDQGQAATVAGKAGRAARNA